MTTWAIVPVKAFGRAKSRLTNLSGDARADLAHALLTRTLEAVVGAKGIARCLVATDCEQIESSMVAAGHAVQRDQAGEGLGAVIDRALVHAHGQGATHAVILMSDLPLIKPADVDALVQHLDWYDAAIAPDRVRAGTNALALHLPAFGPTCFGNADSFQRHIEAMDDAGGLCVHEERNPHLALDVDLPDDLAQVTPDLLAI